MWLGMRIRLQCLFQREKQPTLLAFTLKRWLFNQEWHWIYFLLSVYTELTLRLDGKLFLLETNWKRNSNFLKILLGKPISVDKTTSFHLVIYLIRSSENKAIFSWVFLDPMNSNNFNIPCFGLQIFINSLIWGFPGSSDSKESACNAGDLGSIPCLEDPLKKTMATHSKILS